jgi:hypothetical protein
VAADDEVLPAIGASANENMDMRIVGVPMIDGDPIKFRSQVAFGTHAPV